ncbi:unnamed protein product [Pleuronectes platessa]|uniref:Uncharacterized protein n=1 Tax=Pleuronectes platessa TaxID=8262 RepID=A0A9N7YTM8_PLEPL|nr:unnamed protein product [Pleuronectes platessa]
MCSDKELTLLFLYSSLPRQPSTQSATQPAIQLQLHIHPSSQQARPSPALPCPAQNWQPPGVIRMERRLGERRRGRVDFVPRGGRSEMEPLLSLPIEIHHYHQSAICWLGGVGQLVL